MPPEHFVQGVPDLGTVGSRSQIGHLNNVVGCVLHKIAVFLT
ncbi:MAG: hypothetical protein VW736_11830 [Alphaproteobacteria bacterium]